MRMPPPVIAVAAATTQRALTKGGAPAGTGRRAVAGVTAASSVVLMGSASQLFRSRGTTIDPLRPERASALVTSGPFRITRNPMYLGMAGLLVAHALVRGPARALAPAAAFGLVMDRVQIPAEETAMSARFGEEYGAYRGRVRRWL